MRLTAKNAGLYLKPRGIRPVRVTELGGGVSNTVLLVETETGRFVLKQALGKLRVEQEWRSEERRVGKECRL